MRAIKKPSVEYRYNAETHGAQVPKVIVLHTTESHDAAGIKDLKAVARYWSNQGRGLGAHLIIDGHGNTAKGANGNQVTWAVAGHNTGSLHIEQIGSAKFSRARWMTRRRQIRKVAKWVAYWSAHWDIPLVKSSEHGVCQHSDFGGSHWDCGPNYPFRKVMRLAKKYKGVK